MGRGVRESAKASSNRSWHGVRFEQAREALPDPLAACEDASRRNSEAWLACIGVVISARLAETADGRRYQDK
jgi:uncharacterized DUF497 family protein